jgi:pimeloyl-ACP methyl ester carboxylesterase
MISVVNPIFIDGMGHGKSIKTHEDAIIDLVTHIEIYKEIIIKLKSQLKLNTFILVGRSLGGQICMNLAQEFQDSIVSLGLIAPSGLKSFENSFNNWEKKISILWDKNDPAVGFSSIKYLDHVEHIKKFIISDSIGEIDPKGNTEICLRDKYKKPSHAPEKQYPNFFFKFLSSLLN